MPAQRKSRCVGRAGFRKIAYCTVKLGALVEVPPAFVMEIVPVLAPAGTVTRMKFAVRS